MNFVEDDDEVKAHDIAGVTDIDASPPPPKAEAASPPSDVATALAAPAPAALLKVGLTAIEYARTGRSACYFCKGKNRPGVFKRPLCLYRDAASSLGSYHRGLHSVCS